MTKLSEWLMKFLIVLFMFTLLLTISCGVMGLGCGAGMMAGGHSAHDKTSPSQKGAQLINDPVCGMELDARTAKFYKPYRSGMYYFCSEECQEKFEQDPEEYIPPAEPSQ